MLRAKFYCKVLLRLQKLKFSGKEALEHISCAVSRLTTINADNVEKWWRCHHKCWKKTSSDDEDKKQEAEGKRYDYAEEDQNDDENQDKEEDRDVEEDQDLVIEEDQDVEGI